MSLCSGRSTQSTGGVIYVGSARARTQVRVRAWRQLAGRISRLLTFSSGTAKGGNSGGIYIGSGAATQGQGGWATLAVGSSTSGAGGELTLRQAAVQHQQVEQSSLLAAKVQLHRVVVCSLTPNVGDVGSSGFLLFSSGIAIGGNSGMLSLVQVPPPMAGAVPSASP